MLWVIGDSHYYMENNANVNVIHSPLDVACSAGSSTILEVLNDGAHISLVGASVLSPLVVAEEVLLLDRKCHVNQLNHYGHSPLYQACHFNYILAANILFKCGARLCRRLLTPESA